MINYIGGSILFFSAIVAAIITLSLQRTRIKTEASKDFLILSLLLTLAGTIAGLGFFLEARFQESNLKICAIIAYVVYYGALFFYGRYLVSSIKAIKGKKVNPILPFVVLVFAVISLAGTCIMAFGIKGEISTGVADYTIPFFWVSRLGEFALLAVTVIVFVGGKVELGSEREAAIMGAPILVVIFSLLEPVWGLVTIRISALVIGTLLVYVGSHIALEQSTQQAEMLTLQERLLLAAGRMKPHYIYNVMTNIYYLCDMDPNKAQEAIGNVSDYLRNTLETIENAEPVKFSKELQQIKSYLALEKMRFGDQLNVKYDVDIDDFMIPPLTIEPLVENAVKHGIRDLDRPGTVTIRTRKLPDDGVRISVIDDGVGFDTSKITEETHRELIGIQTRMEKDLGGKMTIESSVGEGTTVTITLPPWEKR